MKKFLNRFIRSESGASAVEYGILVGVIALLIIAAASSVGSDLQSNFQQIADSI